MNDWYKQETSDSSHRVSEETTRGPKALVQRFRSIPNKEAWIIAGAILIGGLMLSISIWAAVSAWGGGASVGTGRLGEPSAQPQAKAAPSDDQPSGPVKVSVDDDPVMGNKNAPVTVIEFSDYECPFCKKSFTDVLPELKKNYIDTGKVKLVYRDYPLSFHANAGKEAEAAECARSLGNDATYYKFHDQIFAKTTSNGTGLALTELPVIAKNLGLNVTQFQQCLDSGKFADEVAKDMADGTAAGVSGTPSWIIGASSQDGQIEGQLIVGAQPFSVFKTIIDEKLGSK